VFWTFINLLWVWSDMRLSKWWKNFHFWGNKLLTVNRQFLCNARLVTEDQLLRGYVSRICLSSIPANHNTRPHLISPEPQSSTPARHLILITSAFIKTSTRALLRPVQSRLDTVGLSHHAIWLLFSELYLLLTFCVILSVSSSSSVLLLSDTSSCSSPDYPASVPIHDLLDLEGYHLSDLLFTLQSIIIPVTHLLPAVHLWTYIKTSPFNISLCVCESFRNSMTLLVCQC